MQEFYPISEEDAPYTENEFNRTIEDDIVLLDIIHKDKLQMDKTSRLYGVAKEINHPCLKYQDEITY